jgi:hypothetical protein
VPNFETCDVKSKSEVVGQAKFPVFVSTDEAVEYFGEAKTLELVNSQIKTNEMNEIRTAATKGPSKGKLRSQAQNEILEEILASGNNPFAGDEAGLENAIVQRMAELEEQAKATLVEA